MKVQSLTVGPILGATTCDSTRVWGRGVLEPTSGGPRRCYGVARIRPRGSSRFRQPVFFQMNPNFDMTGVVMFDDLAPQHEYVYQVGCFFSDLAMSDFSSSYPLDWSDIQTISFKTGTADGKEPRSFVFGSCRYLLRLFGGTWFDARGDKTYRSILTQIDEGRQTDQILMLGDQIYADDLNILAPDQTIDEFNQRYQAAFSQRYIRELMSRVPTYMTLDDHEIEDGWPAHASPRDWIVKYPAAIHAYVTYQASHSPLLPMEGPNQMAGVPKKLWYHFGDGCCDFFVTDTRTERYLSDDVGERRIVGDQQLDALKGWLRDGSDRVKFVVTSVPFFPDPVFGNDREDKWSGFLRQRTEILELIRQENLKRVVFLGGDLHVSVNSELVSPGAPEFKALSIVSSAFYWPYPHAGWRSFQLSGQLSTVSENVYEVVNSSPIQATDNFTRVSTDLERLKVEVFSRKGQLLSTSNYAY